MKRFLHLPVLLKLMAAAILAGLPLESRAVRAYPNPVTVTQPDGTRIRIQVHGDEFFNYKTTDDGYLVAGKSDGYYYYADYNSGNLKITNTRVGSKPAALAGTRGVPQDVVQKVSSQNRAKFARATRAPGLANNFPAKGLVILVGYKDQAFAKPLTNFDNMLNQQGYSDNGATGSARDYYRDNSMNTYNPQFDVYGPYTLSKDMAYYGEKTDGNSVGIHAREMILEACALADADGVNFAQYDSNGDGVVDNVFVYFAGHNPAEHGPDDNIWPHQWTVSGVTGNKTFDGVIVDTYACSSELKGASGTNMAGIGTFCHEFGHVLGLPDFYQTVTYGERAPAFYSSLALMDAGNYNNEGNTPPALTGLERHLLGWAELIELTAESGEVTVKPVAENESYIVKTSNTGGLEGEYFVIDNRQQIGWDAYINSFATAPTAVHGLLIYHIDRSDNSVNGQPASDLWSLNKVNAYASHECARVVIPSGRTASEESIHRLFFPGPAPAVESHIFRAWYDIPTEIMIKNISEIVGGNVTFTVEDGTSVMLSGMVYNSANTPVENATVTISKVVSPAPSMVTVGGKRFSIANLVPMPVEGDNQRTTGPDGAYSFEDLEMGTYSITANKYGYTSQGVNKDMSVSGIYQQDLVIDSYDDKSYNDLQWYGDGLSANITTNIMTTVMFGSMWTAADLAAAGVTGKTLDKVSAFVGQACEFKFKIFFDQTLIYSKQAVAASGLSATVVDLCQAEITIPENKSLYIGIEISQFDVTKPLMVFDGTASVSGKANLFWDEASSTWFEFTTPDGIGNFIIGARVQNGYIPEEGLGVKIIPGQRYADLTFYGSEERIDKWFIKLKNITSGEETGPVEIDSPNYTLEGLTPKNEYEMRTAESVDDFANASKHVVSAFSTLGTTSEFEAMDNMRYNYTKGSKLRLRLTNVPQKPTSQVWKLDGQTISGDSVTLNTIGEHTLTVDITYSDGRKEKMTRVINVQ